MNRAYRKFVHHSTPTYPPPPITSAACPCCGNHLQVQWPFLFYNWLYYNNLSISLPNFDIQIMSLLLHHARNQLGPVSVTALQEYLYVTLAYPEPDNSKDCISVRMVKLRARLAPTNIHIFTSFGFGYYLQIGGPANAPSSSTSDLEATHPRQRPNGI